MNRTFALPKPPFRRTRSERPSTTYPTTPQVSQPPISRQSSTQRVTHQWSAEWDTGWAAGSWVEPSWAAASWATPASWVTPPAAPAVVPATPAPQIDVTVYGINEPTPGPRWRALFDATWPAYRAWYLAEGSDARPDLDTATAALSRYMPELMPTYRRLVELVGGPAGQPDDVAARMLTLWNAPAFLPACSQAALTGPDPVLCRNYDYSPELWENTIYTSAFTGRRVIGTGDCLWGLLDGMNDAGLAISLTFGGRPGSGPGFAIPLVVRYLLEVAGSVAQARELLRDLPVAMSYNLTMVDTTGAGCTAFVAPGQPAEFSPAPIATNHHGRTPEFPERAASLRSVPRLDALADLLARDPGPDELAAAFLTEPLYNTEYSRAFGTLYTAVYRPAEQVVEYRWPEASWKRGFDDADEVRKVQLSGR